MEFILELLQFSLTGKIERKKAASRPLQLHCPSHHLPFIRRFQFYYLAQFPLKL